MEIILTGNSNVAGKKSNLKYKATEIKIKIEIKRNMIALNFASLARNQNFLEGIFL